MSVNKQKKVILDYLEKEELIDEYAIFLGVEKKDLLERLKRNSKVKNMEFAALYAFKGITPKDLGLNIKMDFSKNNLKNNKTVFKCFSDWVRRGNRKIDFTENYFQEILNKVERAENQILIYNYFVKSNDISAKADIQKFYGGYLKYFKQLELQVKSKSLTYKRMLSLSYNPSVVIKDKTEYIRQAIFKLFDASYGHILRSFDLGNFELYVLPIPRRNFSYVLIDEAYVMSEYYRISRKGIAIPDLLFIEEIDEDIQNVPARLHYVYNNEFNDLVSSKEAIKVSKDLFMQCTVELYESKSKEAAQKREEISSSTDWVELELVEDELEKLKKKYDLLHKKT